MPGLAMLVVAFFAAALTGMFKRVKNQKTVKGTIVSLECKNETGESSKYYAYVEYEVNGRLYVVKSRNRSTAYRTGQKLNVAYNKEKPDESFIKPKIDDYIIVAVLFVIAICMIVQTI